MKTTFSKRIDDLKLRGWIDTKTGMANNKYAFLWYQIDTDAMSNKQWEDFLRLIDK